MKSYRSLKFRLVLWLVMAAFLPGWLAPMGPALLLTTIPGLQPQVNWNS
jgi:hypothetical protein